MDGIFVGIDCGTGSARAIAVDGASGGVIAAASRPLSLLPGLPPGHAEQDPRDWIDATRAALVEALAKVDRGAVRGIGVSAQQHGFVPLDASDEPIRPAKLWCDTSTAAQCARIVEAVGGPARFRRRTGNGLPPGFTASKVLWLKEREPANYARFRALLLPHDYLNHWLTGEKAAEWGDASGTGLFDPRTRRWSRPVCAAIDPDLLDRLPPLRPPSSILAPLRAGLARDLGLPRRALVSIGSGDNMMGAIGTGNVEPGVVTASLGTSGTLCAYADRPVVDPRGEIAAFCDATGGWLPLACTLNATVATELTLAAFGEPVGALDRLVSSVPPGAGGLACLPYFQGERTPDLPRATGVFLGLNRGNFDRAHFARAAMEGATLALGYGLRRLRELAVAPREIRITGGGAASREWRSIAADVFGCPVVRPACAEGAAFGAALQALAAVASDRGARVPVAEVCRSFVRLDESTRVEPDAGRVALYAELQARHDAAREATAPLFSAPTPSSFRRGGDRSRTRPRRRSGRRGRGRS